MSTRRRRGWPGRLGLFAEFDPASRARRARTTLDVRECSSSALWKRREALNIALITGAHSAMPTSHFCLFLVATVHGFPSLPTAYRPADLPPVHVHLVPHTHDDVGWLKTLDQYHTGSNNSIQHANVGRVITSVVESLSRDPARKFIYAEVAFFQRWWRVQSNATQAQVRKLVDAKQLTFVNGGWCMHDEAVPHYIDMVDQQTLGHSYLKDELSVVPVVGWQIDPFGHSATQAALLSAESGFDGLFFGRMDYQDLDNRLKNKAAEWMWRPSFSLGGDAQVFAGLTGSYGGNYGPPGGFCWDVHCNDEPMQDDPSLDGYNVDSRVADFVEAARWQANRTRGAHVLFTMGSDFQYEQAEQWFDNMDKLIKYANAASAKTGVTVGYSSMNEYVSAKLAEPGVEYPLYTDDFYPYADGPHMFWTGFFTSRPALKRYVRTSSSLLQAARQVIALAAVAPADTTLAFEQAIGVAQHHDAVTGTEMQHVAFDYARRIHRGAAEMDRGVGASIDHLLGQTSPGSWTRCEGLNVSVCALTQAAGSVAGHDTPFVLYNSLAQEQTFLIGLPVSSSHLKVVQQSTGVVLPSQIVKSPWPVTNYEPDNTPNAAPLTAYFEATLSAMSLTSFVLRPTSAMSSAKPAAVAAAVPTSAAPAAATAAAPFSVSNGFVSLDFDASGALRKLRRLGSGSLPATPLTIEPRAYTPHKAIKDSREDDQPSGAYMFRPKSTAAPLRADGVPASFELIGSSGDLVQEVRQRWTSWCNVTIRLRQGRPTFEMEVTAGPLPAVNGTELILRLTSTIASNASLYTDSNAREMLHRVRDFRSSWTLKQTEPVAGNYYPATTAAYIKDASAQLTLLVDAAQGVASLADGQLEVMVHRRLTQDDSRGVSEPLNETEYTKPYVGTNEPDGGGLVDGNGVRVDLASAGGEHSGRGLIVRGKYVVSLERPDDAAAVWRPAMDALYAAPTPYFGTGISATPNAKTVPATTRAVVSSLSQALPPNVQIVTLRRLNSGEVLLRLAHQFGINEHPALSRPVSVDLASLFAPEVLAVSSAVEMTLTANQRKDELLKRRQSQPAWRVVGESVGPPGTHAWRRVPPLDWATSTVISLGPLEIKTFLLRLA